MTIFATFFAYNLEVISCVFLSLSKIKCYNLQYRLSFSCFSLLPNSVLHNQRIYLLRSLYAIFKILTLEENLTGLYSSNNTSKNVPSYHLHLYHIFHWLFWTFYLNYTVHWTMYKGLGLCIRSWSCSTCFSLHLDLFLFIWHLILVHMCLPSFMWIWIALPNQPKIYIYQDYYQ